MFKFFFTKTDESKEHLLKERLLMLVDGELSTKEAARAREHLETCWTCRSDLEMVEETISEFMDFRKKIQLPLAPAPPKNWGGFSSSMESAKNVSAAARKARFQISNSSPFRLRLGIASISVLLIGVLIIQLILVRPISASDLLDKAESSQTGKLGATTQPVIYQKLRGQFGDGKELNWEIWFDAERPRVRRSAGTSTAELQTLDELKSTLEQSNLDPHRPLAPESFRSWHDSLSSKSDEIVEADSFIQLTTNTPDVRNGTVREVSLKFRSSDYHTFESTFVVSTTSGDRSITITEVAFEVTSLASLDPNFFDDATELTKTAVAKDSGPATLPELAVTANSSTDSSRTDSPPPATAGLEIEVLRLLSSTGADMGDQVNVTRENGLIYVRGLVETPARRSEILSALNSVRQNPAIRVDLETVAEALAKKKQPTGTPTSVENLETDGLKPAVENELAERFGSEAEARRFSSRVVGRSGQAMSRVYALRKLARQFSAAEIKTLSPEARSKWLSLMRSHANAFKEDYDALSRDIGSAFGASSVSGSAGVSVVSLDDIAPAVESLFQLASVNDRSIRSALTISSGGTRSSALKSDQFWRSLRSADALAARLAAVK